MSRVPIWPPRRRRFNRERDAIIGEWIGEASAAAHSDMSEDEFAEWNAAHLARWDALRDDLIARLGRRRLVRR